MASDTSAYVSEMTKTALTSGAKLKQNRYEIRRVLGQESFGITYQGWDSLLQTEVAIKEYRPWEDSVLRDRHDNSELRPSDRNFKKGLDSNLRKIRTLTRFEHLNIVRVYDAFKANGTGYLVMKYESGESLLAFLKHYRRVHEKEILEVVFPLLEGLRVLHMAGILHRNIQPSNIILRPDGSPCLLDFGIGPEVISKRQLTSTARHYSPPERFDKRIKQGPWTDIYALGAVCYRIIAGQQPQTASNRLKALRSLKPDPLKPAEEIGKGHYRRGFLKAVDGALSLDGSQRPQNTLEWREMVVPTGMDTQVSDRQNGGLLGKLRHLFRSPEKRPSRPELEVLEGPAMDASKASTAVNLATESFPVPSGERETESTGSSGDLSDGLHTPHVLTEVGELPSEAEKTTAAQSGEHAEPLPLSENGSDQSKIERATALAHSRHAEPQPVTETVGSAPTADIQLSPKTDEFSPPTTVEPLDTTPQPRALEEPAMPEGDTAPHGTESPGEELAAANMPDKGMAGSTKTEGGLDKLFESSRQPSITQSVGIAEHSPPEETPPHEKQWSNLFELHERTRPTADVFTAVQTSFKESQIKPPAEKQKAAVEVAISAVTAHNERAWQLFRDQDYAGALAELEAAKALEPENAMLTANIKRIQQRLQHLTEPEADPWATS